MSTTVTAEHKLRYGHSKQDRSGILWLRILVAIAIGGILAAAKHGVSDENAKLHTDAGSVIEELHDQVRQLRVEEWDENNNNRSRDFGCAAQGEASCRYTTGCDWKCEDINKCRCIDKAGESESMKRQLMRNLFTAMMISHGTPLIYGGDEWMRTQLGNNNAYSTLADNEFNWFDWGVWEASDERHRMHDFVRAAIKFRKDHAYALAPDEYGKGAPFSWKRQQKLRSSLSTPISSERLP